jgi:CRISPR-associated endonuclease Cas2
MQPNSVRHWVIGYDISRPATRRRVARTLEALATRIQKSVFTTTCTQHEAVALLHRLEALVGERDRVDMWPVIARAVAPGLAKSKAASPSLPPYWLY